MHTGLLHAHSGLRWVVLLLMLVVIAKAVTGWRGNKPFSNGDRKLALFAMISLHIQLTIGLVLYFIGDNPVSSFLGDEDLMQMPKRFWAIEHAIGMIIAIALATRAYSSVKKMTDDTKKFKRLAIYYGISLLIILLSIPWPFRNELIARPWF